MKFFILYYFIILQQTKNDGQRENLKIGFRSINKYRYPKTEKEKKGKKMKERKKYEKKELKRKIMHQT